MKLDAKNCESIAEFEEWVKSELRGTRKEPTKEQPMSDTLQEREDQTMEEEANEREIRRIRRARLGKSKTEFDMTLNQFAERFDGEHQVTKSGDCAIPGCPCRGWSAQETATVKEVSEQWCQCSHAKYNHGEDDFSSQDCRVNGCDCDNFTLATSEHQPTARGGGDRGCPYPERHQTTTYIPCRDCDYRDNPALLSADQSIKPLAWMRRWAYEGHVPEKVKNAKGRWIWPREARFHDVTKAKVCTDDVPLYTSNQHQPLMAERELLVKALRDLLECSRCKNGCAPDDMTCATSQADAVLATIAQRSTTMTTPAPDINGLLDQLGTQLREVVKERDELRKVLRDAHAELECTCGVTRSGNRCEGTCVLARINTVLNNQKERSE